MFEPMQKCENNAISKQNYTLKWFIALKMTFSCCFSLGGNLDLLQKIYNIDYRPILESIKLGCSSDKKFILAKT